MSPPRQAASSFAAASWQPPVTPPALATAMEAAMASAAEVSRAGRRIIQKLWDAEPVNDRAANEPIWCLGRSYTLDTKTYGLPPASTTATSTPPPADGAAPQLPASTLHGASNSSPDTPPDSVASSFDSSLAYEEPGQDGGWPPAFLDDFESRIWMTYRNAFLPIPKSTDPKAATHLSFAMRLRTSLGDQNGGFSSDTGWGCMIRSGQSLLANAISVIRLGRGEDRPVGGCWRSSTTSFPLTRCEQIGGAARIRMPRGRYWRFLQTIPEPLIPCTTSSSTARSPVASTLESGLAHLPLLGA